jgi:hypothetical protein
LKVISAALIVLIDMTAEDSFAAIRARIKLGMAMAAIIRIMATTISNSMSEKPLCFRMKVAPRTGFRAAQAYH